MQGKKVPERMTDPECSVGIDVCKDWLDAHRLPAGNALRVANSPDGIRKLKRWLRRHPASLVAVEATGKWHRALHRSLHADGIRVAVIDPFRLRMFAKAHGILAKTDTLDARVLAMFAAMMNPAARPPAPQALQTLQELVRGRASAVADKTALQNQRAAAETPFLRRQLDRRIARLDKDIDAIETEVERYIVDQPDLAWRQRILLSVPGIGPIVAATLLACLPEIGTIPAKQITALAGLAPVPDDSGERQGYRRIKGGRQIVRDILYLAALSAAKCNNDLKAFYQRKLEEGKAKKLALVAVARKLLLLASSLISDNRLWTLKSPKSA